LYPLTPVENARYLTRLHQQDEYLTTETMAKDPSLSGLLAQVKQLKDTRNKVNLLFQRCGKESNEI
jgi:hypothetical protein